MTPADLKRLYHRVVHMVRPAVQSMNTDETGQISRVQVSHNKLESKTVNHMQTVGFASAPPIGTDFMLMNVAGDGGNSVIVASNHQGFRPKNLKPGELCLYDCAQTQQSIYLKADGSILITGTHHLTVVTDTDVTIQSPKTHLTGDLQVDGKITIGSGSASDEAIINGSIRVSGEVTAKAGTSGSVTLSQHKHSAINSAPTPGT